MSVFLIFKPNNDDSKSMSYNNNFWCSWPFWPALRLNGKRRVTDILEVKDKHGGGGGGEDNKQTAIEDMVSYTKVH